MSELQELYQEMVIDHNGRPRNFRKPEGANRSQEGYNPICGDKITLYVKVEDDLIADIGFLGSGCAISKASASMMTESVKGKSKAEAEEIFNAFREMITREPGSDFDYERVGDLEILSGIPEFPARVKCAVLSWHTLHYALEGREDTASTE